MVDLGFLLITFFVFTTTMSKATVMKINMPDDTKGPNDEICNSCVLTVLLCKNDLIQYYEGDISAAGVKTTNYNGIRNIIQQKKKKVKQALANEDRFVLIIKPAEQSSFNNFVDITDEVTINCVKRYYIDEISKAEKIKMPGL